MAFTPTSTVYLLDTPLDNKYKNQIDFVHQADQLDYFRTCRKHTYENVTYQRKNNSIRVNENIDDLWDSNYVQYQNSNFSTKWFYAFITKMEYISANVTDIFIETDVYQTWMFECSLKDSFVVREHVLSDKIGEHLIDEQLEYGDYKIDGYVPLNKMGEPWNVLAVSDNSPFEDTELAGGIIGNVVTGLTYYPFPNTDLGVQWLRAVIDLYTGLSKIDAIVMIFTVPKFLVKTAVEDPNFTISFPLVSGYSYSHEYFEINKVIGSIDGYVPKNKKLISYPYKFLYMSNNNGQSASYRYEDFPTYAMGFGMYGSVMPDPKIIIEPNDYKGLGLKPEYGLTLSGYPLGSWVSDAYSAWFAQNVGSVSLGLMSSVGSVVLGGMTGNPLAMAGGSMAVANELAQIQKASIQPDQARGQTGSGSLKFSINDLDFYYGHMTIKSQFAKRIDDFLTMYGYKVNALKVPNKRSRYYWNYIKTVDVNIDGTIPDDDMERLKAIYNDGVTLWHNPLYFLDYSKDNAIGDLYSTIPTLLSGITDESGSYITLTFSEPMANPEFKDEEFALKVDGVARTITTLELDSNTSKIIVHYTPAIQQEEVITLSYTKGTLLSADRGILASFTNRTITNGVPVDPELLTAYTSVDGTVIVLTFDKNMNNPIGTEYEWEVKVNDVVSPISSIEIDSESEKYIITMTNPILVGETVITGYTRGTIKSADNGILRSYYGFAVTNNAIPLTPEFLSAETNTSGTQVILKFDKLMSNPSGKQSEFGVKTESVDNSLYQKWNGYPDSLVLTSSRQYQCIIDDNGSKVLITCGNKLYKDGATMNIKAVAGDTLYYRVYNETTHVWGNEGSYATLGYSSIIQCNKDIYTSADTLTILFAKTTSDTVTTQLAISTSELDANDNKNIILSLSPSIANGQTVKTSYTKGTVKSSDNGELESYTDESVTNNVVEQYQQWNDYNDSPELSAIYPYQAIVYNTNNSRTYLYMSKKQLIFESGYIKSANYVINDSLDCNYDALYWGTRSITQQRFCTSVLQANTNVYTDSSMTTIAFAKTTT